MPKSKKETVLFSFLISAIMIFLMAALNHAVRTGGLTAASWTHAVHAFIPGYLFGMLCDLLICTPFSRWITVCAAGTDSRECIQVFIIRFSMVVTMTIFMTLFGVVAGGARGMEIVTASLLFFPYNFTIALPVQMLAVAPFSARLVRRLCPSPPVSTVSAQNTP